MVHINFYNTLTEGDQNSIHKVLGAHLFPFVSMEHSEVSGEYVVGFVPDSRGMGWSLDREGAGVVFSGLPYPSTWPVSKKGDSQPCSWRVAGRPSGNGSKPNWPKGTVSGFNENPHQTLNNA